MRNLVLAGAALAILGGGAGLAAPAQAGDFHEPGYGYGSPPHARPAFERHPGYGRPFYPHHLRRVIVEEERSEVCRVIVRERVDRFGDLVVRRIRVCD